MPPGSYSDVFGGSNIYPSQPSYLLLSPLAANVILDWPIEQSIAGNLTVADIIDVNATAVVSIQLSDATQVSTGYTALFNNIGADTFTVLNSQGGVLATITSGTVWQLYLSDNTTAAGTWRVFQFGAGVSQANAAALAGAGLIAITTTLNQNYITQPKAANYAAIVADRSTLLEWTGGNGTLSLPGAGTVPSGWFVAAKNSGSGVWTVSVATGADVDGETTLALDPEQSCFLIFDGTNYATLGLGVALNSIFNFISISLTGVASPLTLSGPQLNRISYEFTGVLTANMVIVVPNTVQQYWVNNQTTGAFTLTVETPTPGGTVQVAQGTSNILYSDGTNVIAAVSTAGISFPIPITEGGTNATTAGVALTNLGGGSVGVAVFEAASQATAQAALGIAFSGAVVRNSGNQVAAPTGTVMSWDTEVINDGPWHSISTNPSRFTVPTGIAFAEIIAEIEWGSGLNSVDTWQAGFTIRKNGAGGLLFTLDCRPSITNAAGNVYTTTICSGPLAVTPGDYFELLVQGSGISATGTGISVRADTLFQVKALY
jgi:hypothetical protein